MINIYTVIGLLTAILIGYYGPKYSSPPKPKFIGIDLGTTYSCVGSYQSGTGDAYVIPDQEGHFCMPSIVSFSPTKGVLVGFEALDELNGENTLYDSKRIIGRKFNLSELKNEIKNYPFKINLDQDGNPYYLINDPSPRKITPTQVACLILERLKNIAHIHLQKNITDIVMSFPADFSKNQREYSLEAAKMAGLKVQGILSEPTAASMAYGVHLLKNVSHLIVVDFGGGTFDVSLLFLTDGVFTTLGMAGDNHLGGQDVNSLMIEHLTERFGLVDLKSWEIEALNKEVERVKILLSTEKSVTFNFTVNGSLFLGEFERSIFDEIIIPLHARIIKPIAVLLENSGVSVDEVDQVLLVGGSTRIPAVRNLLEKYFKFPPNASIDPEIAVVRGVSMHAGIIGGMWPVSVSVVENSMNISKINV